MKKTLGILIGGALLVGVVWYTDKATRESVDNSRKTTTAKAITSGSDEAVKPGTEVPDMIFKDLQGNNVNLAAMRGKVVWLDFWQTWCEPCKIEIPWLMDLQQKYSAQGFTVLGVALDDDGAKVVDPFLQKHKFKVNGQDLAINYPIVLGNEDQAEKMIPDFEGYPTGVLISRDGKIMKVTLGLVSYDEIDKAIQGQLQSAAHPLSTGAGN